MKRECIINNLYKLMNNVVSRTLNEEVSFGQKLTLNGDPYASGKFALALSLLIEKDPQRRHEWPETWGHLTEAPCENWGKYYFLQALHKLSQQGALYEIFTVAQLQMLKDKLDWREMVDEQTWRLNPRFPTNYYGVAFSVARLRFLLGWEGMLASQNILQRLIEHYRAYSENGCSDETNGQGRFDRYSVLLIAEICQRHLETGLPVAGWLKSSLRQAATLVISMLNDEGHGFLWGRSIGAYGDSAFNEILAVSMQLGLLTRQERAAAAAFSLACSERFLTFWYDRDEQSVNLWFKGRQTDAYRAEHRLVGENISLCVQHLNVQNAWVGVEVEALTRIPLRQLALEFTAFREDKYVRGVFHWHDRRRSFVLPLINGDKPYHGASPYFPVPFSADLFTGIAQGNAPLWVPTLRDERGRVLQPLVWFTDCQYGKTDNGWEIIIQHDALDVVSENGEQVPQPLREPGIQCKTRYLLLPGMITREDTFTCLAKSNLSVSLRVAFCSDTVNVTLQGYELVHTGTTMLRSPTGPLAQEITGQRDISAEKIFTVNWQVRYY